MENRFARRATAAASSRATARGSQGRPELRTYDRPGWGHRGDKHYRKQGFGRLFFSS